MSTGAGRLAERGGEEALQLAREQPPDIITLDVLMPHMDGWAYVGKILQKGSYTRKELLAEVSTLVGAAARRQPHPS